MYLRTDQNDRSEADLLWLENNKVKVFLVERLHAKIYMNEHTVLLSSMNLHSSSAQGSLEIAYFVRDPDHVSRIRNYVRTRLTPSPAKVPNAWEVLASQSVRKVARALSKTRLGFCIRCRGKLEFDSEKPLCDDCYDVWANFKDPDYPEKLCHSCGQPAQVSYARPLCRSCFAAQR